MAGRPKGLPKTGGRPKGQANKKTLEMKEILNKAFDQIGGLNALVAWGKAEPASFYQIWAKMLPRDVVAQIGGIDGKPIGIEVSLTDKLIDSRLEIIQASV